MSGRHLHSIVKSSVKAGFQPDATHATQARCLRII